MSSSPAASPSQSLNQFRAWLFLVGLSWRRQARMRQMVWIALSLMVLSAVVVYINRLAGRWGMHHWRTRAVFYGWTTYQDYFSRLQVYQSTLRYDPIGSAVAFAVTGSNQAILQCSDFLVFARAFVLFVFLSFLLPIWSLSFATEAIGGERESQSLLWLLTRPMSRPAIYLAKFVAMLPWALALNLGGFALVCLAAGRPGVTSFALFWPAVFWATVALSAFFMLLGAYFRRPAIVGIVYCFFLETIIGNMPGTLKRISINFYARCMMFEAAQTRGLQPDNPSVFEPVSGSTARLVLILATLVLLLLGMVVFSRAQYETAD